MTFAPASPHFERKSLSGLRSAATAPKASTQDEAVAEERRWLVLLLAPFALGAVFFAAALGTGRLWLMGGSIVLGVMGLIFAFLYLSITSNSN